MLVVDRHIMVSEGGYDIIVEIILDNITNTWIIWPARHSVNKYNMEFFSASGMDKMVALENFRRQLCVAVSNLNKRKEENDANKTS